MPSSQQPFDPRTTDPKTFIKLKEMDLQAGYLGRLFGSQENAAINISGLVCLILLLLMGIAFFVYVEGGDAIDICKILAPIITLSLGSLFGRKSSSN